MVVGRVGDHRGELGELVGFVGVARREVSEKTHRAALEAIGDRIVVERGALLGRNG
jgi:cob(I)alamin adenosyltransferase